MCADADLLLDKLGGLPLALVQAGAYIKQTNMSAAFGLVRQLLAERPRRFQQLVKDGVAAVSVGSSSVKDGRNQAQSSTSTSSSAATSSAAATSVAGRKGKGKAAEQNVSSQTVVPEGHPFVSTKYVLFSNRYLSLK